jgi:hypothetical protein
VHREGGAAATPRLEIEMKHVTLAATAMLAFLCASPLLAWAPTSETERSLAGGQAWAEVLPDTDGAALIRAAVDIQAPPKVVWAVMTDCRLAGRMIANLISCKIVQGDLTHGWDVREQVTRGNLFIPDLHNVVRSEYQPFSLIKFQRAGGDLRIEDGEWRLQSLNGGAATRVIYINRVAVNILAPAFVVRAGIRRDTPKVLLALRRESLAAAGRPSAS